MSDSTNQKDLIPDSFSLEKLEELRQMKADQEEYKTPGSLDFADLTEEQAVDLCNEAISGIWDKCNDPAIHKLLMLVISGQMIAFHTQMGKEAAKKDDEIGSISWLRDAGKFQAISNLLFSIQVSPDDSYCDQQ